MREVTIVISIKGENGTDVTTIGGVLHEDNPRDGKTNRKNIEALCDEVGISLEDAVKDMIGG